VFTQCWNMQFVVYFVLNPRQTQALVSSGRGKGLSRRSKGLFFHKFLLALLALAPLVLVLAEGTPAAILAPAPDALVREGC